MALDHGCHSVGADEQPVAGGHPRLQKAQLRVQGKKVCDVVPVQKGLEGVGLGAVLEAHQDLDRLGRILLPQKGCVDGRHVARDQGYRCGQDQKMRAHSPCLLHCLVPPGRVRVLFLLID